MSATSEELAAQAEQLSGSIAYFRVDERRLTRSASSAASHREARPIVTAGRRASAAVTARKPVKLASAAANGHARNGYVLDLANGSSDAHDAEFERY
jgi:methyl-accepting chemotaxis protein